ncbi:hypothetical protein KIW84_050501 [Lathyrus oleraceus]|uniref:Reverse transcriptase domain-containing protein n=1 Tax=Pisum sativum TaxID=3888 RepID=A0A9D4WJJ1_PEA|nr:hypothetical protein KIW84_050501 [Pisum sativum]
MSPFLFLLASESLIGLVKNLILKGDFQPFRFNEDIQYEILEFANDPLIIGEGIWSNLWSIKGFSRGFELVPGLCVNFHKSKLFAINLKSDFLEATSSFLSCEIRSFPFLFLGIPIGANPRRKATKSTSSVLPEQHHASSADDIELPIFVNDRAYVPEPPLETKCRKVWYRSAFIPYMLAGKLWLNDTFESSLEARVPPNLREGIEGPRLAKFTPDDGNWSLYRSLKIISRYFIGVKPSPSWWTRLSADSVILIGSGNLTPTGPNKSKMR